MSNIEFYLDNCMNYMAKCPNGCFDLAIIDPQYGIGESKKVRSRPEKVRQKNGSYLTVKHKHTVKEWDNEVMPQCYYDELFRVAQKHIIFGENYIDFAQKKTSTGRIFWDKVNGDSDFSDGELMWTNLFSSVRQIELMWSGFCQAKSLSEGRTQQGNKKLNQVRIHPTEKPILLYKWLLSNFAKQGWKILDTHLGSASIAHACFDLGFDLVGTEIDSEYFHLGKERFEIYKQSVIAQPKFDFSFG